VRFARGMSISAPLSRREVLRRLGAGMLLSLGAWPGCQAPDTSAARGGRPFRFIAVNDLHHATAECDPFFEALVRQMRTHSEVEFALLLGDLADTAAPASHAAIRDHFRALGKPFFTQIGNHDHQSATDRVSYVTTFPGPANQHFEHRGWQILGLDTTQGTAYENTRIADDTLAWVDGCLPRLDRRKPTLIFTHFPLGGAVKMRPANADPLLERFLDFNLQGVLCGHYHAFTQSQFHGADVVTNRCCSRLRGNHDGTKEKGYWLIECADGRVAREFVRFDGVPGAKPA